MSGDERDQEIATGTSELRCRVEEGVARVVLDRPHARNALSPEMKTALVALLPRLESDPRVRCVLLTGAGEAFCAGGDRKRMAAEGKPASPEQRKRQLRREHEIPARLFRMAKPTLAALPGPAAGAGFALALACDLRIMAERAFVTTAYVKLALSGDYGTSWFLTQLVGPARAKEIQFTGMRLSAADCLRLGLVNRVTSDSELQQTALALARELAAGPPIALRTMKDNINRATAGSLESLLDLEAERMVQGATTDDYVEAVKALQEGRPPLFRGE